MFVGFDAVVLKHLRDRCLVKLANFWSSTVQSQVY